MISGKKFLTIFILIAVACLAYRCAQIIPLSGGAKDVKPPVLISVVPADRSINVPIQGTKIFFRFNEMIAAPTASQKLIVNPMTDEIPDINVRGKILTVEFSKPLKENTTYLLQFGNSVVDIHENNAIPNFTYIFSTGSTIDSSSLNGKVIYALSQDPVTEANIMLYKNLSDTAPLHSKPDYMTKVALSGIYSLSAIKPGTYQVIALADKNKNLMYDAGEGIGFLNAPVLINNDTINFTISAAKTANVFVKKKSQAFLGLSRFMLSDTLPDAYVIASKSIDANHLSFETRNDTLEVYYKGLYDQNLELLLKKDKVIFDTVDLVLPSKAKTDSSLERAGRKINFHAEKSTYGIKYEDIIINFSLPLKNIVSEKCFLVRDTIKEKPLFTSEKSNEERTLVTNYYPQYKRRLINNLIAQSTYTFVCLPNSLETFWSTFNQDTVKTVFKTFSTDEIGNLQIKLELPDSIRAYILQLMNANSTVVKEFASVNKKESLINFYNLLPGDYSLRLIEDADEDKKFSPSNFLKHVQPEPVWYNKKPLKILAGWDVEAEWNMKTSREE